MNEYVRSNSGGLFGYIETHIVQHRLDSRQSSCGFVVVHKATVSIAVEAL